MLGSAADPALRRRVCRAFLLLLGIWMALCGGTLYAFSAFELELKDRCHISARQLDVIYACGQFGVGLGIVPGVLYDRRGPRLACLYALIFIVVGNFGMRAALQVPGCGGVPTLGALFLALQNGTVGLYQVGLFANLKAAPPNMQGVTAGLVAAGFGLSAALFTAAYADVFGHNLPNYLAGTATVFSLTALVALVSVARLLAGATAAEGYGRLPDESGREAGGGEASSQGEAPPPSVVGQLKPKEELQPAEAQAGEQPRAHPGHEKDSEAEVQPPQQKDPSPSADRKPPTISLGSVLLSPDLWVSVGTFSLLQAVGSGIFIANLSLMADSLGISADHRLLYIRVVSYCNCLGRIAAGCLIDLLEPLGVPRAAHHMWSAALLMLGAGTLVAAPDADLKALLFPALLPVGAAYGVNWAVMPAFLKGRFGAEHIGVCFNLHSTGLACLVAAVSWAVGGLYDAAAAEAGGEGTESERCQGAACWRSAYRLGLALAACGAASAAVLALRAYRQRAASRPHAT